MISEFQKKLEELINCESMENGSHTPDFLLAQYLMDCLNAWNKTVNAREQWYGRDAKPINTCGDVE